MHWIDVTVDELLTCGKRHVVESGTSISGEIHIGNAGDVIIADALCRGLKEKGAEARRLCTIRGLTSSPSCEGTSERSGVIRPVRAPLGRRQGGPGPAPVGPGTVSSSRPSRS